MLELQELHMIILCDADGPLIKFNEAFLKVFTQVTGIVAKPEDINLWKIRDCSFFQQAALRLGLSTSVLYRHICSIIDEPGFCLGMEVQDGAEDAMDALHVAGHEVYVVTSPWETSPTWFHERTEWLLSKFILPRGHVIGAYAKERVSGHVFIDDKPENCAKWKKSNPHGVAILFAAPFNRDEVTPAGVVRGGWNEIVEMVRKVAA